MNTSRQSNDSISEPADSVLRVCFVSLYSYGLFNQSVDFRFGGAEVRSRLLGTALSNLSDYQISFVVFDHQQKQVERYGQIELYRHSFYGKRGPFYKRLNEDLTGYIEKRERFPYMEIHAFTPSLIIKLPLLGTLFLARKLLSIGNSETPPVYMIDDYPVTADKVRVYHEVDADIYCVFGTTDLAGEVAAYCKDAGKKFVLFLASDHNLVDLYETAGQSLNVYNDHYAVSHYAIQQADLIFVQTEHQRNLLSERFGRKGIVIRNPIDLSQQIENVPDYSDRRYALWVGKANSTFKQPMMLIELAKRTPEIEFLMIMNPHTASVEQQVKREKPDNVTLIDRVPFNKIDELFANAFVFVNTSSMEGFPNTFLQAGKYGVPVLSLQVDPDEFIEGNDCGIVAKGDFDRLVDGLRTIRNDAKSAQQFSQNIKAYVQTHHSLTKNTQIVDQALQSLTSSS